MTFWTLVTNLSRGLAQVSYVHIEYKSRCILFSFVLCILVDYVVFLVVLLIIANVISLFMMSVDVLINVHLYCSQKMLTISPKAQVWTHSDRLAHQLAMIN